MLALTALAYTGRRKFGMFGAFISDAVVVLKHMPNEVMAG